MPNGAADKLPSLEKFRKAFLIRAALEAALLFGTLFSGALLLALLLVQSSGSQALRWALLGSLVAVSAGAAGFLFRQLRKRTALRELCRLLMSKSIIFRDVLSGYELSIGKLNEGISQDLALAAIADAENSLSREKPEAWFSLDGLRSRAKHFFLSAGVLAITAVFPPHLFQAGWTRLMYGLDREMARHMSISPQGGKVPLGSPVTVTVELLAASAAEPPRMWVKGENDWAQVQEKGGPFRFTCELAAIVEPTHCKVTWQNFESRSFTFLPVDVPRLTDFTITLKYPPHTGEKPFTFHSEPQIHAYRGTEVEIAASATKDLQSAEILTRQGLRCPVEISGNRKIRASFKILNPMEFWFDLKDEEGMKVSEPILYSVTVKEDEIPSVQILAPSDDLWVGQEAMVPFTFETRDDLGVREILLEVERGGEATRQSISLKKYDPAPKQMTDEHAFPMSSLKPSSGEKFRVRLQARDNDAVTGPKSGFSNWVSLEVRSYEKEHEALEKELSGFRDDLLEVLSEQTLASLPAEALKSNAQHAVRSQSAVAEKTKSLESKLGKILDKMESDPLSDFSVWSEHQALKDGLGDVREGAMNRAQKALESQDFSAAAAAQEAAVSQLERLSNLSEEIQKFAKMRDLTHSAENLENKSRKLAQKLSQDSQLTEALKNELKQIMNEAFKLMSEIAKAVQDLPKELPEDFVNRPAVKEMNFDKMVNSLSSLSDALERGDLASALKMAQELLKQAQEASKTLAQAAQETADGSESSLASKGENSGNQIDELASKQEEILRKTRPHETKRKERYFEKQKNLLEELAAKQSRALEEARGLTALPGFAGAVPAMEKVLKELRDKNVIFSQKWLGEIIQSISPGVLASTAPPHAAAARVQTAEEEILEQLKNPPKPEAGSLSEGEKGSMKELGGQQQDLAAETSKLAQDISKMGSSSALVKPEMMEAVQEAQKEMENARKSLQTGESESAVQAQERALSHLRKGGEMMQSMSQSLSQMKQQRSGGSPQTGMVQPKGSGGPSGFRRGVVRIPGADDYAPPKEFREEILESLKEKYPESQENLIKDYFKRLIR